MNLSLPPGHIASRRPDIALRRLRKIQNLNSHLRYQGPDRRRIQRLRTAVTADELKREAESELVATRIR